MGRNDEREGGSALIAGLAIGLSAFAGVVLGVGASILSGAAPAPPPAAPSAAAVVVEPSASPPPAASAAAAPVDAVACLATMFPEDTFAAPPSELAFVCDETQPVKGASRIKEIVVKAGTGRVSGGMKEWAILGHYGIAAFASIRARCCPSAVPLEVPELPATCDSMGAALEAVGRASVAGASDDDATAATEGFRKSLSCALRGGPKNLFGDHPAPGGGETTTFKKTLDRARSGR